MRGRSWVLVIALLLPAVAARAQDGGGQGASPPPPGGATAPPPPPAGATSPPPAAPADSKPPAGDDKSGEPARTKAPAKPPKGVGEPAPRLTDVDWLLGKPVKQWTRGTVYLLYFWAPYDEESLRAFAHLAELQKANAAQRVQVILVGIQDKPDVVPIDGFVKRRQATLPFTIAADKLDKTTQAWDTLVGLKLARAVLVDKTSRVAWSGNAFNGLDDALAAVLADDKAAVEKVVAARREVTDKLNALDSQMRHLLGEDGMETKCLDLIDQIVAIDPRLAESSLASRYFLLLKLARKDDAAAWGRKLVSDYFHDDEMALNDMAWSIVDPQGKVKQGDIELAGLAAERSNALTSGQEPQVLDTLARVRWVQGKKDEAVALQATAVKLAWTGAMREALQKTLDEYKAPPRK
jgi:hypothetical protein